MIFSFKPKSHDEIINLLSALISTSEQVHLLQPNSLVRISKALQLPDLVRGWPGWSSRPWIIAGDLNVRSGTKEPHYSGPFMEDCRENSFNLQVDRLLSDFDWALFSYFTTYQCQRFTFICKTPESQELFCEIGATQIHKGPLTNDPIAILPTATFYDYDIEGLLVHELAMKRGEGAPLLLCRLEDNKNQYRKWDDEKDELHSDTWYKEILNSLESIADFKTKENGKFMLFQANDLQAYTDVWKEASEDHSIAEATLSSDTDISKLESYLNGQHPFEVFEAFPSFGSWVYFQVYGGGSDEHHALFFSNNAETTHQLWNQLGTNQISRF